MDSDNNYWEGRWKTNQTGWDVGGPHPHLSALFELAGLGPPASVWIPGCGRAHDGAALAMQGYRVLATDLSPTAISAASTLYSDVHGLKLAVEDLFAPTTPAPQFDILFDRAMLCALPPSMQADYLSVCWNRLRPGGAFCSILFSEISDEVTEGPPFTVDKNRLELLFAAAAEAGRPWRLLKTKQVLPASVPRVVRGETLVVAQKGA